MSKALSIISLALALSACQATSTSQGAATGAAQAPASGGSAAIGPYAFVEGACADCHAIHQFELSPNPEAPPFADIANRPGLTAATLSTWLRDAHNYPEVMDFDLGTGRVDELTTYILTLRDPDHKPSSY